MIITVFKKDQHVNFWGINIGLSNKRTTSEFARENSSPPNRPHLSSDDCLEDKALPLPELTARVDGWPVFLTTAMQFVCHGFSFSVFLCIVWSLFGSHYQRNRLSGKTRLRNIYVGRENLVRTEGRLCHCITRVQTTYHIHTLCRWSAPHLMTSHPGASSNSSMTARWRCRIAKCKAVCRWLV